MWSFTELNLARRPVELPLYALGLLLGAVSIELSALTHITRETSHTGTTRVAFSNGKPRIRQVDWQNQLPEPE